MKKVLCIGLCFIIVLCSFALCFADGGSPVILPVSDGSSGLDIPLTNNLTNRYFSNNSPVYIVWASWGGSLHLLTFSEVPNTISYWGIVGTDTYYSHALTSVYNGYYYSQSQESYPASGSYVLDGDFSSVYDVIDYIDNSVFSTTFDLTYLIDGSVSWFSSLAQAVKNNGLLLFFVLFIFVGVGVGLLKRFTN